ncbi:MAG TPA: isoprenylcysteine carboxylmethyltransferase family protein [Actinomycetota bacterium]
MLQVLLFLLVAVAGGLGPGWPRSWRVPLWFCAALLGAVAVPLIVGGSASLGPQLTPFPRPVKAGTLKQDGVYRLVRHPIYGGGVLVAIAGSLATSPLALVPTVLLAALFELKHRREELWLSDRYPEYEDYRRRVPRRFIPFVW